MWTCWLSDSCASRTVNLLPYALGPAYTDFSLTETLLNVHLVFGYLETSADICTRGVVAPSLDNYSLGTPSRHAQRSSLTITQLNNTMKDGRSGHPRDHAAKKAHRSRCNVDPMFDSDTLERTGVTRTVIGTKKLADKGMSIIACAETVKRLLPQHLIDAEVAACKANGAGASAFQVQLGARPAGSNSIAVNKSVLKALGRKGAKWRLGRLGHQVKHVGLGNTREEAGGKAVQVVEYVLMDGRVLVVLEPETAEEPDLGQIEVVEAGGEEDGEDGEDDDEEEEEEAGP